jgi:hypothetical protein
LHQQKKIWGFPVFCQDLVVVAIPVAFLRKNYLGYWLKDGGYWVSIPGRGRDFSLLYGNQTGYEAHLASYAMDICRLFPQW